MNKPNIPKLSLFCLFVFLLAGCVSGPSPHMSNSSDYVRQHKGEGTKVSLLGSEAELMEDAVNSFYAAGLTTVTREPHAVFGTLSLTFNNLTYAAYFSPSQTPGYTDVEIIIASRLFTSAQIKKFELDHLINAFPFSYLNSKLLEPGYDPNVKEGYMLALSMAAFYDYQDVAVKLIKKGADIDASINELKERATDNIPYLDKPANKKTYDQANAGVAMLTKLKRTTRQSAIDNESDVIFQEALRANPGVAAQKQQMDSARKFKVQADDAVRESKFDEAIDLYQQALNIAPLWPEGHFNRALLLGNRGDYEIAIREMKRYLLLAPNASNADVAQNKIYSWERKAGAQN